MSERMRGSIFLRLAARSDVVVRAAGPFSIDGSGRSRVIAGPVFTQVRNIAAVQ